jgi:hypothetical protein
VAAFLVPFLACSLCSPPPLRDEEPPPRSRAPELSRQTVEILPQAKISLPTCEDTRVASRSAGSCAPGGPALGGELTALYRPSSYFAFGPSAAYSVAHATGSGEARSTRLLALGISARVYLLETGAFDPYLESLFGWGYLGTTSAAPPGRATEGSAFGPLGRVSGGLAWLLSPSVKLGLNGGFTALVLPHRPLYPQLSAGLELGFLLGDRL